ncbi:TBC1 domain family member 15 [Linum perenne]
MQETELHDLSDDSDYAASIQQGSARIMLTRTDSGNRSLCSEPEGAEVIYLKDNVTIHPTQFASERISGRLKLVKQGSLVSMTWIPYRGQSSNARLTEKDRNLYTIRAVPFSDVRSVRRHTPTLGWQYIIIVLSSGLAFPPLYFYNGGVREFLATLKQHVLFVRSMEDANVFLVNDFQSPLQRTLSSLEMPGAVSIGSMPSTSHSGGQSSSFTDAGKNGETLPQSILKYRQRGHDPGRDLSIQLLEKFSLVTKFARETKTQLFRENSNGSSAPDTKKYRLPRSDTPYKEEPEKTVYTPYEEVQEKKIGYSPYKEEPEKKINHEETHVPSDPLELEKLALVWGKPRQSPLGSREWATFLDSEGRITHSTALRRRIFYGGVEHTIRKEVWAFLAGYHNYESTHAEREYLKMSKRTEYLTIKQQWQSISSEQAKRFTKYRERKGLIDKDVVRTDRSLPFYEGDDNPNIKTLHDILLTYSFYNFDLGYCQGMSDILSPILYVTEDESESFWCFVSLMERLAPNFNRDQNGMHSQLFALSKLVELLDTPLHNYLEQNDCLNYFFCFRWLLIQFKREFEYKQIMCLWEVLWTRHLSEHLHLYLCVAILKRCRKKIMGEQMDFDTLLKFINELSGHIDLDPLLRDAEALCIHAGEHGAACIPPVGHFLGL